MNIEHSAATHRGRRKKNEDSLLVEPEMGLYAVADGVGGAPGGEVASRAAVDTLRRFFERARTEDADVSWTQLDLAVRIVHRSVAELAVGDNARMGTTLAALLVREGCAIIAHVGDSRVYRVRNGRIERLTRDHSLREMWSMAVGSDTPPMRDMLVRAISAKSDARPDLSCVDAAPGDVLLLCTDGVSKPLGDMRIAHMLRTNDPDPAQRLVDAAIAAGGTDNATAIVVRVG